MEVEKAGYDGEPGVGAAPGPSPSAPSKWRQFPIALAGAFGIMSCGIHFSWSSPAFPKIESEDLSFRLDVEEASWIVSVLNLSAIPGALVSGLLVDRFGRKLCLMLTNLPYIACWLLVSFGSSGGYLLAARLLAGVGVGMSLNVVPMYLGEIATTSMRGAIGALTMFIMNLGVLYEYVLGPMLSYGELAWASFAVPVLAVLLLIPVPESPYYHVKKGHLKKAKHCIKTLRNSKSLDEVETEVNQIVTFLEEQERGKVSFREAVSSRGNVRALAVVLVLAFLQQSTGISSILAYFEIIVDKENLPFSLDGCYILVGLLETLSAAMSSCFVDRLGRRPLFIVSCGLLTVAHGLLGTYFLVKDRNEDAVSSLGVVPVVMVMVIIVAYNGGQGPLVFVMVGECLAQEVKAFGAAGAAILISLMAFVVTKIHPTLTSAIGAYAPFWLYCVMSMVTGLFVLFVVPETKGKSMIDIQNHFSGLISNQKDDYDKEKQYTISGSIKHSMSEAR